MPKTGAKSLNWPLLSKQRPAKPSPWPTSIKAIQASRRRTTDAQGIELVVVKLSEARQGFVLLPKRWVVERSFAWSSRFRRLTRDYERLATTLVGLHVLAFTCLLLHQFIGSMLSP